METSISYLAQDPIFEWEKPFDTDVPVDHIPRARAANHKNDEREVTVFPIIDATQWDLEKHGFCFIKATTGLTAEDALTRKEEVQKDYWYEIEALLHQRFPQYSRIECYDCTVCCFLGRVTSGYCATAEQQQCRFGREIQTFPRISGSTPRSSSQHEDRTVTAHHEARI